MEKSTNSLIATFTAEYLTIVCEILAGYTVFGEPQTTIIYTITDPSIGLTLGRIKHRVGRDNDETGGNAKDLLENYVDQYQDVIVAYNGIRALRPEMPRRYARSIFKGLSRSRLFN